MTKLLVIIGVTGQQGGSVANTFINDPKYKIRGITRNPDKPENQKLRDRGVELVAADLDDVDSLRKAFAGAHVVFAVTDFWQFMKDPETVKIAEAQGKTINEVSFDREVAQGKNIVDAAAGSLATLERFVLSTLSHTRRWTNGRIRNNYHFDSKGVFTEYMQNTYAELNARSNLVHIGMYMTNWLTFDIWSPQRQPDGTYVMRYPNAPNKLTPFVHPPKDTGTFVRALLDAPAGTNLFGVSQECSMEDFVKAWGKSAGVEARYEQIPLSEWKTLLPEVVADEVADSVTAYNEIGWCGGEQVVMPRDIGIRDDELTSVEEYFSTVDWSSVDLK